jgi:hypothetical protein
MSSQNKLERFLRGKYFQPWAGGCSTVVQHSPHHPKVEGSKPPVTIGNRGLYYKTFYGRNLQIFVIS